MIYTVKSMTGKQEAKGSTYEVQMGCNDPVYQSNILAVTKAQFDALIVGAQIEISITPIVAPEAS